MVSDFLKIASAASGQFADGIEIIRNSDAYSLCHPEEQRDEGSTIVLLRVDPSLRFAPFRMTQDWEDKQSFTRKKYSLKSIFPRGIDFMRTKRYDKRVEKHKWACRKHDGTGKTKPLLISNEDLLVLRGVIRLRHALSKRDPICVRELSHPGRGSR